MHKLTFLVTAAAITVAAAGRASAQHPPFTSPHALSHQRAHEQRTREFDNQFRRERPPHLEDDRTRRALLEKQDRDAQEQAARQTRDEQDRRRRDLPWSATPWSDARWGR